MIINSSRIEREKITVSKMIRLYCRLTHQDDNMCDDCSHLHEYAMGRLDKCPFRNEKPTCTNCPIHCYKTFEKEKIREIMRFSGPRMILYHPILALFHIYDNKKKKAFQVLKT